MTETSARCPRCGAPLTGGGEEICPACLIRLALDPPADDATRLTPPPDDATRLTPVTGATASGTERGRLERIGPYRIVRVLGEGGMGVVYLAEQHEPIRRTVALKVIKLGMDTREVVARFESERQALALMDHPNIARVIDAGATPDGRPFFVMEHVSGVPITEYCDVHQLSTRSRIALIAEICGAIQHAHQKGIIHRDLKPSNVLVMEQDGTPTPKIIDFGIAKATDQRLTEQTMFTQQGQFIGTPEYMSPEQTGMDGLDVDATTDIYSLGVLMYELLAGALPFEGAALRRAGYAEMLRIIREDEPPRPSTRASGPLRTQLAGDIDWITLKAMEKDRTRRYASASEFAADIARHLNNEPVLASPPSASYRAQKFVRRHRLAVTAAALVFTAIVAGLVVSIAMFTRAERSRVLAEKNAYSANLLAADVSLRAGDVAEARRRLASCPPNLRAWEWHYLQRSLDSSARVLRAVGPIQQIRLAPDGVSVQALVVEAPGYGASVRVSNARLDGAEIDFTPASSDSAVAVSPDGRIALHSEWRVDHLAPDPRHPGTLLGVTKDSTAEPPSTVTLRDLVSGRDLYQLELPGLARWRGRPASLFRFHKSGDLLVPLISEKRIGPVRLNMSRAFKSVAEGRTNAVTLSGVFPFAIDGVFSGDGRRVAAWTWSNTIYVWDVASGRRLAELAGHQGMITSAAFTGDGGRLVSASEDGSVVVWDIDHPARNRRLRGHAGPVLAAAASRDGGVVASIGADQTLRVWLDAGTELWRRRVDAPSALAVTPDGKVLATGHDNGRIRLWDVASGFSVSQFRGHASAISVLTFSADGGTLIAGAGARVRSWPINAASARVVGRHDLDIGLDSVAWTQAGVLASTSSDLTVRLWPDDPAAAQTIREPAGREPALLMEMSGAGASSFGSGRLVTDPAGALAASSSDLNIEIWDTATASHVRTIIAASQPGGLALERGGERLFVAVDKAIHVFHPRTGAETATVKAERDIYGLQLSDDGRWLLAHHESDVGVWDARTLRQLRVIPLMTGSLKGVAISPDGERLAALGMDDVLTLRRLSTGDLLGTVRVPGSHYAIAFHPAGNRLAMALEDGGIRIFDATTLEPMLTLRDDVGIHEDDEPWERFVPPGVARYVQFRRMSKQLVGSDGLKPAANALAFSPDGTRLGSGWTADGTVRLYDARPRTTAEEAQSLATSLLSQFTFKDDVLVALARDLTLGTEEVRREATRFAATSTDDPQVLNEFSWRVVRRPGASPGDYWTALARAEAAVRGVPGSPAYLNTLALAQYRVGDYRAALKSILAAAEGRNESADKVIEMLVRFQLGEREAVRDGLKQFATDDSDSDVKSLIAEAKALADSLKR
jgi:WD40 repeat protein/serine/threonine protein kinase